VTILFKKKKFLYRAETIDFHIFNKTVTVENDSCVQSSDSFPFETVCKAVTELDEFVKRMQLYTMQ